MSLPSTSTAAVVDPPSASSSPPSPSSPSSSSTRSNAVGGFMKVKQGGLFRKGSKSTSSPANTLPLPTNDNNTSTTTDAAATTMIPPLSQEGNTSNSIIMTMSAPTILIRTPSSTSLPFFPTDAPRGIMRSKTLTESLHNRRSSEKPPSNINNTTSTPLGMRRAVSFANVNIREYERVLGDNPSVTGGPPLSIGWRHTLEPIVMKVDEYEGGKGLPRSSSEYLVPKAVREKILKEHACVSRRDMAATVRSIQKEKAKRRKTVTNLNLQGAEEVLENVRRGIKTILKPSLTYQSREAKLWDEAHVVAMEKAKRLEESIHRGENVQPSDFYKVGTICNSSHGNDGGSGGDNGRRNTVPVVGGGGRGGGEGDDNGSIPRRNTAPAHAKSPFINMNDDNGSIRGDTGGIEVGYGGDGVGEQEDPLSTNSTTTTSPTRSSIGTTTSSSVSATIDQHPEQPQSQKQHYQQQEESFDSNLFVKSTSAGQLQVVSSAEGGGFRRGSHASIVAMESDGEDDVLANLTLDDMNISSSRVEFREK